MQALFNDLWANANQFPFHVSIRGGTTHGSTFKIFSGVLIRNNFVLTTASAVVRSQEFQLRFNSITHYTGGTVQISHDARIHPNFNPQNNAFNVALIRFATALPNIQTIRIALPNPARPLNLNNRLAVMTAYGRDSSNELSPVLQYAWTTINPNNATECRALLNNTPAGQSLLCGTTITKSRSKNRLCPGDSGSPLFVQEDRDLLLVGVGVSGSQDSACPTTTTLFTSITAVRDWLLREASV